MILPDRSGSGSFSQRAVFLENAPYTYEEGEYLTAEVEVANFGKESISGELVWTLGYRDCAVNTGSGEYSMRPGRRAKTVLRGLILHWEDWTFLWRLRGSIGGIHADGEHG